jgi:hypothetical protein
VFEQSYHLQENWADGPHIPNTNTGFSSMSWTNGVGGYYEDDVDGEPYEEKFWPAVSWPDTDYPTGIDLLADEDANGNPIWDTNTFEANPPLPWEHGNRSLILDIFSEHQTTDTEIMLATGGTPGSTQQNLWVISATAAAHTNLNDTAGEAIPPTQIQFAGLGTLGSDGNLYLLLPDGVTNTITPRINGTNDYTFNVWATKYKTCITANDAALDSVAISTTNCVGQRIIFKLAFNPPLPSGVLYTNQNNWVLPGDYVNAYEWFQPDIGSILTNTCDGTYYITTCDPVLTNYSRYAYNIDFPFCTYYKQTGWPLTQPETGAWWITGGPKAVTCFPTLTFTNGQIISLIARGNIMIYRPTLTNFTSINPIYPLSSRTFLWDGTTLSYGNIDNNEHGLWWSVDVNSTLFDGLKAVVQLGNVEYVQNYPIGVGSIFSINTGGGVWLDGNSVDYTAPVPLHASVPATYTTGLFDDPHAALNTLLPYNVYMTGQFTDYVQFQPTGVGSIFVTLGTNSWSMTGEATLTGGIIINNTPAPTTPAGDDSFPVWTSVIHE